MPTFTPTDTAALKAACDGFADGTLTSTSIWNGSDAYGIPNVWDVTGVDDMAGVCQRTSGNDFNLDIGNWNVSGVTNMDSMFKNNASFNQDISGWNTSKVDNMDRMFENADSFIQDINTRTVGANTYWDVSKVTKMSSMFKNNDNFNGNISAWDTGKVTTFLNAFHSASNFNQDISGWDVSSATNMYSMFNGTSNFSRDLSKWNVDNVTNFNVMFTTSKMADSAASGGQDAPTTPTAAYFVIPITDDTTFNAALDEYFTPTNDTNALTYSRNLLNASITKYGEPAAWDTSEVTTMYRAFKNIPTRDTTSFNEDLSDWDTSKVLNMEEMFMGAVLFNGDSQPLAANGVKWDVSKVTTMKNMFNGAAAFDQIVRNWRVGRTTTLTGMFSGATGFTIASNGHDYLSGIGYFTSATGEPNYRYFSLTSSNLGDARSAWFHDTAHTTPWGAMSDWNVSAITNFSNFFSDQDDNGEKKKSTFNEDLSTWDTGSATSMLQMFLGCDAFTGTGLGNWDVSKNTNFHYFAQSTSLNADLSGWNVDKVTTFANMFTYTNMGVYVPTAKFFTQDVGSEAQFILARKELLNPGTDNWDVANGLYTKYGYPNDWTYATDAAGTNNAGNLTDLSGFFYKDASGFPAGSTFKNTFNAPLSDWKTGNVTDMSGTFRDASGFNQDLSGWVTSAVTDMTSMFSGATSFNKVLKADVGGKWDVSSVTDMTNMFNGATDFNHSVRNWWVGRGTTLTDMFDGAHSHMSDGTNGYASGTDYIDASGNTPTYKYFSLKKDPEFNTARSDWFADPQVKSYGEMGDWNVSAITDFGWNPFNKKPHNEDLNKWDIGSVTTLNGMFRGMESDIFNNNGQPLLWDTSKVTDMGAMFQKTTFNQNINTTTVNGIKYWDVSKVTSFSAMFYDNSSFLNTNDLSNWDTSNVTQMTAMFHHVPDFSSTGSSTLRESIRNWNVDNINLNLGDSNQWHWGLGLFYGPGTAGDATIADFTLPVTSANFNDAINEHFNPTTGNGGIQNGTYTKYGYMNTWDTSAVTDMSNVFKNGQNGNNTVNFNEDISNWDTSAVNNMSSMFNGASGFNQDLSGWKTQLVTTMEGMFQGCTAYNKPMPLADTNKWNVSAVTTMKNMFNGCTSFNQDISTWTTSAAKNMSSMFNDASGFNQDISSWQTHEVTDMASMFNGATSFAATGGMTKSSNQWNTVKVTDMSSMFKDVNASFNPNLTLWTTSAVKDMSSMFNGVTGFNANITDWTTSSVTDMSGMFEGATGFNNGGGTALSWNTVAVTSMASMFKGAVAFDQDLSGWNVSAVKNMTSIFEGATVFGTTTATNNAINIRDWAIDETEAESPYAQLNLHSAFKDAPNMVENIRYWDVASGVTTTDIFSGATAYLASDHAGKDHAYWSDGSPGYQYFDYTGTVCFLGSEKVRTDQGSVRFDKLTTDYTINGYNIKKVTKMLNSDDHLIFVGKDAVNKNIPNKGTYISRNHGIVMNNHIVRAKTLENGTNVLKIPREPDMIYNVLTIPQTIMFVNNMPCETINPNDPIVQRYI